MLRLTLSIGLSFFLFGCGGGEDIKAPLALKKFVYLKDKAKLQAPTSSNNYKLKSSFYNQYFYLTGSYMTFKVSQEKIEYKRSELRFLDEWNVTDAKKWLFERVKLVEFNKREFTFLQILEDSSSPQPLLRVAWYENLKNQKNHIWAVIRLNNYEDSKAEVDFIDLGEVPRDFFDINVSVDNGFLSIKLNNIQKLQNYDISYWKNPSYFKMGVYLQDIGEAKIFIYMLKIN
jgi:hypothetical protein